MHTHRPPATLAAPTLRCANTCSAAAATSALDVLTCVGLSLACELGCCSLMSVLASIVVSVHCVRKASENPLARPPRSAVPSEEAWSITPGLVLLHTFLHPLLCTVSVLVPTQGRNPYQLLPWRPTFRDRSGSPFNDRRRSFIRNYNQDLLQPIQQHSPTVSSSD